MRVVANIGIAFGISMIMFGPNAALSELSTVAAPIFLLLHVVDSYRRRTRKLRLNELELEASAERRRVQELLGL